MAIINEINLRKKIQTTLQAKSFVGFVSNAANTRFISAKQNMLEELIEHPVTKEIEESCANPSTTNSELVSKGNIASLIGFYKGSTPAQDLELFLRNNTTMDKKPKITLNNNKVTYSFIVNLPSKTTLYEEFPTPDNWTSRSWLDLIENGVSYISKYIFNSLGFKKSGSRSGTGLQSKGSISNVATFSSKPYITEILNNFKLYFKK